MRKLAALTGLLFFVCSAGSAVAAGASPSFSFSTDASGASWKCQLDSGSAAACSGSQAYSNVAPGKHTVTLTATFEVDAAPVDTAAPVASGTAQVGQSLSTTNGTWTGYPTPTYSYQWQRCASTCSNISGATSQTYVLQSGDVGDTVQAVVMASNSQGSANEATNAVGPVASASGGSGGSDPVLAGDQTVEPTSDSNGDGSSQAWSYTASTSGTASSVSFYVNTGNSGAVTLGVYSDSGGNPGQLLASASIASPTAGQWNQATFSSPPSITSGTKYWLAVLGTGGSAVHFRDNAKGTSCSTETSQQGGLTALPSTWKAGQSWSSYCPASFYIAGTSTTPDPPAAPQNTAAPTISGTAQQGDTLSATQGSWSNNPTSYSYQWQGCAGGTCSNISGATSSTYTLQSSDVGNTIDVVVTAANAGGQASATSAPTGAVAAGSSSPSNIFPLKDSSNGRYLETQSGQPFLMVGDAPQSLVGNLSESSAASYLSDRAAHGFNTVWVNLLCTSYTFCASSGDTYDGIAPFTSGSSPSNYDLSTPNSAYFQRAHADVAQAEADGLEVALDPIETGGWETTLEDNGATKDYNYGVYLGNLFKDLPNIIWLSGNDYQDWPSSDSYVTAVMKGIQSVDPTAVQSIELNFNISYSLEDSNMSSLIGLDAAYTYAPTYAEVQSAYAASPTMPTFLVEANYEEEKNGNNDGCVAIRNCRLQEYWTMTSGATGQIYGCGCTDGITNSWTPASIDTPGVTQLGYQTNLLKSLDWYDLVPDTGHTLVTAGYGTYATSGDFANNNYVTAAETPDHKLALAYVPQGGTITVDMSQMAGSTTARWFDPTNGQFTSIAGSPLANSGSHSFTTPGNNSAGDSDWLLVLQAG